MKFLTFVDCGKFFFGWKPEHQTYYHVSSLTQYRGGSYWVGYQDFTKQVSGSIHILAVHYGGLRYYSAINTTGSAASDRVPTCGELVVLPWSEPSQRPFYFPRVRDDASSAIALSVIAGLGVLMLLICVCALAMDGFLLGEDGLKAACIATLVAVFWLNVIIWGVTASAWWNIDTLTEYYGFYDHLPRTGSWLLPLSWSQAQKVFAGPPHPSAVVLDFSTYYTMLFISSAVWLIGWAKAVVTAVYVITTPDPFEELCQRAAAQGRMPTPEEYTEVLMHAALGKSARELELLKYRAAMHGATIDR